MGQVDSGKPVNVTVRLDRLIGRTVLTRNNRRLGRLEECRAEQRGRNWVVVEWMVGPAGLFERLGLGARMIVGPVKRSGFVVKWNQLDLTNPDRPRLTCAIDDLQRF
jgi:hypothetical protein